MGGWSDMSDTSRAFVSSDGDELPMKSGDRMKGGGGGKASRWMGGRWVEGRGAACIAEKVADGTQRKVAPRSVVAFANMPLS